MIILELRNRAAYVNQPMASGSSSASTTAARDRHGEEDDNNPSSACRNDGLAR